MPLPTLTESGRLVGLLTPNPALQAMAWRSVQRLTTAWDTYHFTLDYETGFKGDRTDATLHRFKNPSSIQLDVLRRAAFEAANTCRPNPQLFGEYLHALQDTFAHRDSLNKPYGGRMNLDNFPSRQIGHTNITDFGATAHRPDHTYNQFYFSREYDPTAIPGGSRYFIEEEWAYNEIRTLEMQRTVFEDFKFYAARLSDAGFSVGRPYEWRDLAGDGEARIGLPESSGITDDTGRRSVTYQGAPGATGVLQRFNSSDGGADSAPDDDDKRRALRKADTLNEWLQAHNLRETGEYRETTARTNRRHYLDAIDRSDPVYDGIIFETE